MPTIVHFDIAADDPGRAKQFYEKVFDWNIEKPPGPMEYYMVETEELNGEKGVGGGLGKRGDANQKITLYIGVNSVDEYSTKVEASGGKVVQPKMTVPGWGYLAICMDTENNMFGLWEDDKDAQ